VQGPLLPPMGSEAESQRGGMSRVQARGEMG
jgi:hypothetical protein